MKRRFDRVRTVTRITLMSSKSTDLYCKGFAQDSETSNKEGVINKRTYMRESAVDGGDGCWPADPMRVPAMDNES